MVGVIVQQLGPMTYLVDVSGGRIWRRHIDHFKEYSPPQASAPVASDSDVDIDVSIPATSTNPEGTTAPEVQTEPPTDSAPNTVTPPPGPVTPPETSVVLRRQLKLLVVIPLGHVVSLNGSTLKPGERGVYCI